MPQHCSDMVEQESSRQGIRDIARMPSLSQAGDEQGTFQVVGSHNQSMLPSTPPGSCGLGKCLFLEPGEAGGCGGLLPRCLGSNGSSTL